MSDTTSKDDELVNLVIDIQNFRMSTLEAVDLIKQYGIQERIDELSHLYVANGDGHIFVEFPEAQIPIEQRIAELTTLKDKETTE